MNSSVPAALEQGETAVIAPLGCCECLCLPFIVIGLQPELLLSS